MNRERFVVIGGGNSTAKSALVTKNKANQATLVHCRESLRAYPARGVNTWQWKR
jgi:thioredoxin reductase